MTDHDVGFITETATHDPGVGDVSAYIEAVPADLLDWLPSTDDVGAILHGRTRDSAGRLQGIFTATTDPTADQAARITASAADEVASALPTPLPDTPGDDPDRLRKAYRRLVALLAAANIELSYPSSRGTLDRYDRLERRYQATLKRLIEAVSETGIGGDGDSVGGEGVAPVYSFPDVDGDDWVEGAERPWPADL